MLQILLHSSKTMALSRQYTPLGTPRHMNEAVTLSRMLRNTPESMLSKLMQVSSAKATEVHRLYSAWSTEPDLQSPAIDAFRGDIYSGLQAGSWDATDRAYAHKHLIILSGLYGALRACDGIMPYRLEMGYKLPSGESLYSFWRGKIAQIIDLETSRVINLSAVEYTKALLPYIEIPVVTPKFMTISHRTGEPKFVAVHAKIARGAFARWLIQNQIESIDEITKFNGLNYHYNMELSTDKQPVFTCEMFNGTGLSVRLKKNK